MKKWIASLGALIITIIAIEAVGFAGLLASVPFMTHRESEGLGLTIVIISGSIVLVGYALMFAFLIRNQIEFNKIMARREARAAARLAR